MYSVLFVYVSYLFPCNVSSMRARAWFGDAVIVESRTLASLCSKYLIRTVIKIKVICSRWPMVKRDTEELLMTSALEH